MRGVYKLGDAEDFKQMYLLKKPFLHEKFILQT